MREDQGQLSHFSAPPRFRDLRRYPSRKHRARFGKVDEDLHRHSSNKADYAAPRSQGKLI